MVGHHLLVSLGRASASVAEPTTINITLGVSRVGTPLSERLRVLEVSLGKGQLRVLWVRKVSGKADCHLSDTPNERLEGRDPVQGSLFVRLIPFKDESLTPPVASRARCWRVRSLIGDWHVGRRARTKGSPLP